MDIGNLTNFRKTRFERGYLRNEGYTALDSYRRIMRSDFFVVDPVVILDVRFTFQFIGPTCFTNANDTPEIFIHIHVVCLYHLIKTPFDCHIHVFFLRFNHFLAKNTRDFH